MLRWPEKNVLWFEVNLNSVSKQFIKYTLTISEYIVPIAAFMHPIHRYSPELNVGTPAAVDVSRVPIPHSSFISFPFLGGYVDGEATLLQGPAYPLFDL